MGGKGSQTAKRLPAPGALLTWMRPPMACTTWSKAGRSVSGPVSPKPVTTLTTPAGRPASSMISPRRSAWARP